MGVRKCVDCGTVWTFRELKACVFCGGAGVDAAPLPPPEPARHVMLSVQERHAPERKAAAPPPAPRPAPTRPTPEPVPPAPPPRPPAPQVVRVPSPVLPFALGLTA